MSVDSGDLTSSSSDLSRWYCIDNSSSLSFAPAKTAFEEGLNIFKQKLTNDPQKRRRVDQLQASSLQDVLDAVTAAKTHYQSKRTGSKTQECLTAFSRRVCYYGKIMDVMVQHHPEYVSLVWGAMKLLFGAIVEHENVGTTVVTALCDIADSLPRVELATTLYPTDALQQAVALLYAHIVRFLIRALQWYEEGKLAHALHSITRPASLRYDDLIKEIQRDTQSITSHTIASSQVEQRDMHNEIRAIRNLADLAATRNQDEQQVVHDKLCSLTALVVQLRESIVFEQTVNANARIELRNTLTEIQLTQALAIISSHCNIDHKSNFRASMVLRDRHRFTSKSNGAYFWTSPKLQDWNSSPVSSTILLKATFRERLEVRDFCTNVIEQLFNSRVAALWILRDRVQEYSVVEVLKSLILQALSLDYSSHTDIAFSFQLRKFLDARFDVDYLNLLGDVLQHFKLVHIITDAEAMHPDAAALCRTYLHQLSQRLSERGAHTVVKVIVSSYGPSQQSAQQPVEDVVLRIGKAFSRRNKRVPKEHFRMAGNLPAASARPGQAWRRAPTGPSARQRIPR